MEKLKITLACGEYDRTRALMDGTVQLEGVDIKYLAIGQPSEIFQRMLHGEEFDVSELSFSNYLMGIAQGDRRFIAIPVFPSRMFRHSFIWVNTGCGIVNPRDLAGKRIGCPDYSMTALLYIRGLLQHEYGVLPQDMRWVRGRKEKAKLDLPPGVRIEDAPAGQSLDTLLERGDLDALASAMVPPAFRKGTPAIRRLFPNARQVEREYYLKTGIFPIMHVIVIRRPIYEANQWLAKGLAEAFQKAKADSYARLNDHVSHLYSLPWAELDFEESRQLFHGDPYAYGVAPNRPTLEAMTTYSYEQGLCKRLVPLEELFAPETIGLFSGAGQSKGE